MKKISLKVFLSLISAIFIFGSCTKELDLDEETKLAIEKQEKLKQLDELYELAFTDPVKAQTDYDRYFAEELLRDGQNFLVDNDVRMRSTFTDLAIRLNTNFEKIKATALSNSIFDVYKAKFESITFNRSLLGEIPQQIRKGEKLAKFEGKVAEITAYFDNDINDKKSKTSVDQDILGKRWQAMKIAFKPDWSAYLFLYYDFKFLANGGLDIEQFVMYPVWDIQGNQPFTAEESPNFPEEIAPKLLSPAQFTTYNNKIIFYFHIEANPNAADIKFNREWVYEFDYILEDNSLTLSNPRAMRFMHPFLYVGGYGQDSYEECYFEDIRSFTLTTE
ncbi:MAG: hypothetical protein KF862_14895 [Chitinophagaceae bacterium]|nr:hypothetical protein [Chitinophagaceae bacterium]